MASRYSSLPSLFVALIGLELECNDTNTGRLRNNAAYRSRSVGGVLVARRPSTLTKH